MRLSSKANFFFVHDLMEKTLSGNRNQSLCLMHSEMMLSTISQCSMELYIAQSEWDYRDILRQWWPSLWTNHLSHWHESHVSSTTNKWVLAASVSVSSALYPSSTDLSEWDWTSRCQLEFNSDFIWLKTPVWLSFLGNSAFLNLFLRIYGS